ncbi:hypothetical protein [Halochromatium glycolicum]|uniref:hypothetical protein n=1 Tax=Halochromatium glycolicum TaxID=85075 RepID=UPI00190A720D
MRLLAMLALLPGTWVLGAAWAGDFDPTATTAAAPLPNLRPVERMQWSLPNGDPADLYLPRAAPAVREVFRDALPVVALLQGAFIDKGEYSRLARQIAQLGFVVVAPNHARTLPQFEQPVLFAEMDTLNAIDEAMTEADANADSPLFKIVDTEHMAVVGHSLGGVVGLYAIAGVCAPGICSADPADYAAPPALKAAAVYGANLFDRRTGEFNDLDTSAAAVALLQGSLDGIAPSVKARQSYDALEPPSALAAVEGANHYGLCNSNNPAGPAPDPMDPAIAQTRANRAIAHWIGLWLRAELLDEAPARAALEQGATGPDGVVRLIAAEPPLAPTSVDHEPTSSAPQ